MKTLKKHPFFRQLDIMDCGPTCLKIISAFYGKRYSSEEIRDLCKVTKDGVSIVDLEHAAERMGFRTIITESSFQILKDEVPLPVIAHWKHSHFVVVYRVNKKKVVVGDPALGIVKYTYTDFVKGWTGKNNQSSQLGALLVLEPTDLFFERKPENSPTIGYKYLLGYFKEYRNLIFQLLLGLFIGSLIQLVIPFLTQAIVDYGIKIESLSFVTLILIAQLVLYVSQSSIEIVRGWILLYITSRVNISLISDFLAKLMLLPISFFDTKKAGDIMQRIYDHDRIQSFLSTTSLNTMFSVFNLVIFAIILIYYNLTIFLIFLVGSIIYFLWSILFLKKRKELDYLRFDQASKNQTGLFQLITGIQEIKLNGSELKRRWEWEKNQVELFKISLKGLSLNQVVDNGGRFFNEIKNILITFVSARAVINGELTIGMLLSIQYIIGQLNVPISNFVSFVQRLQDAQISFERLSEIHSSKSEGECQSTNEEDIPFGNICVKDLNFRYGGKSSPWILKDIDLTIPKGKVTAIVGSSGSGKTTLLKLLLKFYNPTEGNIFIDNQNLNEIHPKKWREQCGTVMQDGFIFSDTIENNIAESELASAIDYVKLVKSAKIANIYDYIKNSPMNFKTRIGHNGVDISGGQKQRILIARAVYKNPKVILFDEATSALDAKNEKIIMENLQDFYSGKTVVIVAHRLSTVKNANQIIVLENGRVVEIGNHYDLTTKKGTYYNLVKNQLELGQ